METLARNLTTEFLFVSDSNIQSIVSGISTRLRCIFQISNVRVLMFILSMLGDEEKNITRNTLIAALAKLR